MSESSLPPLSPLPSASDAEGNAQCRGPERIPPESPRIAATGLTKKFGPIIAVQDVDLSLPAGGCLSVFGPNGAGKTTLLKMLSLLVRPTAGTIWVEGEPVRRGSDNPHLRARMGFLTHQPLLYGHLSPLENLRFYGNLYGVSDLRARAEKILDDVGLMHRAEDPVRGFSRGMLQRVAIARALLHQPDILFLDEPFTGLDRSSGRTLEETLGRLRAEGRSLVLTTHDFARGLAVCDEWVILHRGRIRHSARRDQTDTDDLPAFYESVTEGGP